MARRPQTQRDRSRQRARELTRGIKQQLAITRSAHREMARQLAELVDHLARLESAEAGDKWPRLEGETEARNGSENRS